MVHASIWIRTAPPVPGKTSEPEITGVPAGEFRQLFAFRYRTQAGAVKHFEKLKRSYPGRELELRPA